MNPFFCGIQASESRMNIHNDNQHLLMAGPVNQLKDFEGSLVVLIFQG